RDIRRFPAPPAPCFKGRRAGPRRHRRGLGRRRRRRRHERRRRTASNHRSVARGRLFGEGSREDLGRQRAPRAANRRRAQAATVTASLSGENAIPTFVAPAEAGVQASARMARRFLYRGRGAVSLLPALRTVRAVLPHTALRSVVIYIEIGVQERELARG